jgi:hypothetical protein
MTGGWLAPGYLSKSGDSALGFLRLSVNWRKGEFLPELIGQDRMNLVRDL